MQEILVTSEVEALGLTPRLNWVVISIGDPGKQHALSPHGWGGFLRLSFHDKEDLEMARLTGLWKLFTEAQAMECLAFAERHWDSKHGLLVHCHAGLSRSPAVARALANVHGFLLSEDLPRGNPHVFNLLVRTAGLPPPSPT